MAVAPPGTDLGDDPLTPAALARLALVATPPGTSIRGVLDRAVRRSGQPADVVVETASRDAVLPLVLAGAGTALMPARLAEAAVAAGAVVRHLQPRLSRRVGIVHRQRRVVVGGPGDDRAGPSRGARPAGGRRRRLIGGSRGPRVLALIVFEC